MDRNQKVASIGFGLAVLVATNFATESMPVFVALAATLVIIGMIVYGGRKTIPRFYATLGKAALAGVIAGIVVLGPLLRGAMRVVALSEPGRQLEFTLEGTLFIILIIGVMAGLTTAIGLRFISSGLGWGRVATSALAGALIVGSLLVVPDFRSELLEFGAGAWMNIPLFAAAGALYGWFFQVVFDRLRLPRRAKEIGVERPAVVGTTLDHG